MLRKSQHGKQPHRSKNSKNPFVMFVRPTTTTSRIARRWIFSSYQNMNGWSACPNPRRYYTRSYCGRVFQKCLDTTTDFLTGRLRVNKRELLWSSVRAIFVTNLVTSLQTVSKVTFWKRQDNGCCNDWLRTIQAFTSGLKNGAPWQRFMGGVLVACDDQVNMLN